MGFWIFENRGEKELKKLYAEMKINLENNYKDNAHKARILLGKRAEELYAEKVIGKKCRDKYLRIYEEYTEKLKNYRH